jgi:enolase
MSNKIMHLKGRIVLDSRGNPTTEAEVITAKGTFRAIAPSGASTGTHEAVELRDCLNEFHGKGVTKAVSNIKKISKKIVGMDCIDLEAIDNAMIELDGTQNKKNLGTNAILPVSMACARAGAKGKEIPLYEHIAEISRTKKTELPTPYCNIINGGKHAGNNLCIQEFMIAVPKAENFFEKMRITSEVYTELKKQLNKKFGKTSINVGDEGGFAPPMKETREPIETIINAIEELGYSEKVKLAIDAAANEFYSNKEYTFDGKKMNGNKLTDKYIELLKTYPIISIEDPFFEDDWESFKELTQKTIQTQIVGDDLLVTNRERINRAIKEKTCNALLLKVNQVGTVTEAINAQKTAFEAGWNTMVSHRSGETEDTFISDLCVGLATGQIKSGAPARGERTAKYNQLIRIEEKLINKV